MNLSPLAQLIREHLQTVSSARMSDLRAITGLPTLDTKNAAYELCRAGLATAEWGGVRFRAKPSICPPAETHTSSSDLADDTHQHPVCLCESVLGAVGHIGEGG